jgi:hypothetical protein
MVLNLEFSPPHGSYSQEQRIAISRESDTSVCVSVLRLRNPRSLPKCFDTDSRRNCAMVPHSNSHNGTCEGSSSEGTANLQQESRVAWDSNHPPGLSWPHIHILLVRHIPRQFKPFEIDNLVKCCDKYMCSPTRYTIFLYNWVYSQISLLYSVSDLTGPSSGASKLRERIW